MYREVVKEVLSSGTGALRLYVQGGCERSAVIWDRSTKTGCERWSVICDRSTKTLWGRRWPSVD
jgi:hypothetical protein